MPSLKAFSAVVMMGLTSGANSQQLNANTKTNGHSQDMDTYMYNVPTFTPLDLQLGLQDHLLHQTLTTNGLLAIRIPTSASVSASASGHDYDHDLLAGICHCREHFGEINGGDKVLLADGLTTRSTLATATMGTDHPLPLPQRDIRDKCTDTGTDTGTDTYNSLERARDYVSQAASEFFVPALDRLIREASASSSGMMNPGDHANNNVGILRKKNGFNYSTVSSIIQDSVNLEHFHSYSKKNDIASEDESENENEKVPTRTAIDQALDWHTDGGLFLAFLPAKSCNGDSGIDTDTDTSFHLKMYGSNQEVRAVFPKKQQGEVIVAIMLGAGSESWLHTPPSLKLRATRHAVKMSGGDERAWYGMMHQVPADAIVQIQTQKALTFDELKKSSVHSHSGAHSGARARRFGDDKSHPDDVIIGCGTSASFSTSTSTSSDISVNHNLQSGNSNFSTPYRRRVQHVGESN